MGGKLYLSIVIFLCYSLLNFANTSENLVYNIPASGFATGGANTATQGLGNVYKNPSAITGLSAFKANSSYSSFFQNSYSGQEIAFGSPMGDDIYAALSIPVQLINSIEKTSIHGQKEGAYNDIALMPHFSIAQRVSEKMSVGSSLSYFYHKMDSIKVQRLALDFGIQMDIDTFRAGVAIKNLVLHDSQNKKNAKNQTLHLGIEKAFSHIPITVFLDMYTNEMESLFNLGISYFLTNYLMINAGINQFSSSPNLRLGVGVLLHDFQVDFSFSNHDILGITQKFSLSLSL